MDSLEDALMAAGDARECAVRYKHECDKCKQPW